MINQKKWFESIHLENPPKHIMFGVVSKNGKKIVLSSIYSSTKPTLNLVIAFRKLYPTNMVLLDAFKKENHTHLALVMQRIESKCIIDHCAKIIALRLPNAPLITRHDSISTIESYSVEVGELFQKTLNDYFKTEVRIGAENW